MSSDESDDPPTPDSQDNQEDSEDLILEEEPDLDEWGTWGNFARLFIFPLIIVLVSVLIYGTFQYLIRDQRSVPDFINTIENGTKTERWRTAYSLAQEVRRRGREKEFTRSSARSIIDLYKTAKDPRIQQYLAHVLAELPLSDSVEALKKGLQSDETGVKVNAILALGRMKDNTDLTTIKNQIDRTAPEIANLLGDESPEVRRMAAFVLGSLGNKSITEDLKAGLDDPQQDVRWNSAIALGQLGSNAGEPVLLDILKKAQNKKFKNLEPKLRKNLLKNAIQSLEKIKSEKALELLRKLKNQHPDSRIREQALKAHETIS